MVKEVYLDKMLEDATENFTTGFMCSESVLEVLNRHYELGIGEEQIRAAVDEERIDFIRIGNRAYIALELFDEPYIQHFTQIRFDRTERRRKADSSALAQIGLLISGSQGIPTVKRIRKTA